MNKNLNEKLGKVKSSKYKKNIIMSLKNDLLCPKEIVDATKYQMSHVSNTLAELKKDDLVVCVNPQARKGRLYQLTEHGEAICTILSKHNK